MQHGTATALQASAWEHTAVLTPDEERLVDSISACCAERPLPPHVGQCLAATACPSMWLACILEAEGGAHWSCCVLAHLSRQVSTCCTSPFMLCRWRSELEAARTLETEEKYRQYAGTLSGHLQACEAILSQLDDMLGLFGDLKEQHREVSEQSRSLTGSCEVLVVEQEQLVEFADALRSRLSYFNELERIAAQFHAASLAVDSSDFLPLLQRLDDCIAYVSRRPQYADSSAYSGKFRQLQQRALATMRTKVQQVLRQASEQVHPAANGSATPTANGQSQLPAPRLGEGAEQALLYVRFRAAAEPGLSGLLKGIEGRAELAAEYAQLLADCQQIYCDTRLLLVVPVVQQHILDSSAEPLPTLMRQGCAYLIQVCQQEHQLSRHFFAADDPEGSALGPLMEPLCTILYDTLRPRFIQLQHLNELCELVDILQHEVLEEQLSRRGESAAPLRPVLQRTLADIQGRLIFKAQAFIKDEVIGHQPQPEDLDYPAKLQQVEGAAANGEPQAPESAAPSSLDAYSAWYPPVRSTLLCLSKLYGCVGPKIFSGLAQDAVAACTASVQISSRLVVKRHGVLDGQLFMIKQLLILREQIAPFEADFAVTEYDLDFSHMRDHLRRIMAGKLHGRCGPHFAQTLPSWPYAQVDSKKELEKLLRATCEAFIMAVTKLAVEPMLSFITKVTAVKVAASSAGRGKPLREQAFASPARLEEMVEKVRGNMRTALPKAVGQMKLYLKNPSTHASLFKPIKSNIAEAHAQIASLLESEYSEQEADRVHLTPISELEQLLSL
eukprot:jgi/Astpho2/5633/e_gw1.00079.14.1_t